MSDIYIKNNLVIMEVIIMVGIKGSVINETIEAVRKRSGDQIFNDIIGHLDKQSKHLFENMILAAEWYPLDSFIKFLEFDIKLTTNGNENELIDRSEDLLGKQLKGIFKSFVKEGSPEFVLDNCVSIMHKSYFNGVTIEKKMEGPDKVLIRYIGFEKQHKLIEYSIIGFYKKALELSGAKNVQAEYLTSIKENKGYCDLEISWKRE